MKKLFFCLLALLLVRTADIGRACEYCRMAAEDPEAARLALAAHASSGAFPLQATINQFKGDAPPAVLTTPPPAGMIATSAADLPPRAHRLPAPVPRVPAGVPVVATVPLTPHSTTWASLFGFFSVFGLVVWRSRRTIPGPSH